MPAPTPIPPESLANRLVLALLGSHYALRVQEDGRITLTRGTHSILILWGPDAIEHVPDLGAVGEAEVVVLGGSRDVRALLKKTRPMLAQDRVDLFHVDDDGDVWQSDLGKPGKLGPLLRRPADLPEGDAGSLAEQVAKNRRRAKAEKAEAHSFRQRLEARVPAATYALVAAIALVYLLEHLFGEPDSVPTLVHMGALVRERAIAEPWRLLSCTFLHGGFMHFAFNAVVLVALGRSLEPILGHERFLVLYVASALGGSLASTLVLGEGISVGASGAIWGLLAAEAVLAYRPGGLLPAAAIPAIKRTALINLGLNIVNSLRPEVDWAAHFGGGLVGGSLVFASVLTVGLPRLADASSDEAPKDRRPGWLRPAAVALTGLLAAGGVLGIVMGKLSLMLGEGPLTQRSLGATGLQIELPASLTEQERAQDGPLLTVVYGDLMLDSMVAEVRVSRFDPPLTDEELTAAIESFSAELAANASERMTPIGEPEEVREGTAWYSFTVHEQDNGLIRETASVFTKDFGCAVALFTRPQIRRGNNVGLAKRSVRSVSP